MKALLITLVVLLVLAPLVAAFALGAVDGYRDSRSRAQRQADTRRSLDRTAKVAKDNDLPWVDRDGTIR